MDKKALLIGGTIIFASVGAFYVATQREKSTTTSTETQQAPEAQKSQDELSSNGRYVEYTKAVLEQNADKRRVLYFYASWCPTCQPADDKFKENSDKIPEDTRVIRVNYNDPNTDQEEKDLAKKYNVTYQHTFVQIDKEANVVAKWNGGGIEELLKNIK
mgnify:CR=1 FL=1